MELDENIRKKLTSEEINELPLVHYGGPVSTIRSKMLLDLALPALKEEPVLGFDTESRPTFRKGVAHYPSLIQLATAKCVYIIQLKHLPLNREITDLLSSPNQIKAGVGIGEDMRELANLLSFTPQGHVDLANIAEKNDISSRGLRSLAASLFGERISKGPQCSNWSLPNLSVRQVIYAATDAWMGRRIFLRMRELGLKGLPKGSQLD